MEGIKKIPCLNEPYVCICTIHYTGNKKKHCNLHTHSSLKFVFKFRIFFDSVVRCVTVRCYKRMSEVPNL